MIHCIKCGRGNCATHQLDELTVEVSCECGFTFAIGTLDAMAVFVANNPNGVEAAMVESWTAAIEAKLESH